MTAVNELSTGRMYKAGHTTWNELVSSGRIELISNQRLKEQIAEYYEHFARYHINASYVEDIQVRIFRAKERWLTTDQAPRAYQSHGNEFTLEEAEVVLTAMREEREFKNLMSSLVMIDDLYRTYATIDLSRISLLLNEFENKGIDINTLSSAP